MSAESPHADASGPIELADVLRRGATLYGRPVTALQVATGDGRRQSFEPPDPADAVDDLEHLTPTQQRIVRALRASQVALSRKDCAARMRLKSEKGRFAEAVSELVSAGEIFASGSLITDDAKKFPEGI